MFLSPAFCWSCFPFSVLLLRCWGWGREYYRKMIAPEYLKHTTTRAPGASRLHGPQSNIAHALPSDLPRRRDGGRRQRRRHTDHVFVVPTAWGRLASRAAARSHPLAKSCPRKRLRPAQTRPSVPSSSISGSGSRACYELGQKSHRNADFTVGLVPSRSPIPAFLSRF